MSNLIPDEAKDKMALTVANLPADYFWFDGHSLAVNIKAFIEWMPQNDMSVGDLTEKILSESDCLGGYDCDVASMKTVIDKYWPGRHLDQLGQEFTDIATKYQLDDPLGIHLFSNGKWLVLTKTDDIGYDGSFIFTNSRGIKLDRDIGPNADHDKFIEIIGHELAQNDFRMKVFARPGLSTPEYGKFQIWSITANYVSDYGPEDFQRASRVIDTAKSLANHIKK